MKRKRYSRKFQRIAVERMRSAGNIGELAKELGVTRRCLYKWRSKLDYVEPGEKEPPPNSHESAYRKQVHQLKRLLDPRPQRFWRAFLAPSGDTSAWLFRKLPRLLGPGYLYIAERPGRRRTRWQSSAAIDVHDWVGRCG